MFPLIRDHCYISVVAEERKHVTYRWSLRRGNMLHISGLCGEETCYISVVSVERKHATYQWSQRRGNMLHISGLCGEETCYISVVSVERIFSYAS
jgi:hypothetical protein